MKRIGFIIGTRPEAIKLMPVIRAVEAAGAQALVIVTGQHRELLNPILAELEITVAENLAVMTASQSLGELSSRLLDSLHGIMCRHRMDKLVVQGDTTSAFIGALSGFYHGVEVVHVEAGLRTHDPRNPFPEEMNRRLIGPLAGVHFPPTAEAAENLRREGVPEDAVHVVGNTVIDSLFYARDHLLAKLEPDPSLRERQALGRDTILVTAHRRESFGPDFVSMCAGIRRLAEAFAHRLDIVYPVHLNPNVQKAVGPLLGEVPNIRLIEPLGYLRFVELMLASKLIITDSGGVQEEAAALGIPVLVTRRTCERLEAVASGVSQLTGPDEDAIFAAASEMLGSEAAYRRRAVPSTVFGDGAAAGKIAGILLGG